MCIPLAKILNLRHNKTNNIMYISPKAHLTYFHSARPPGTPHLQFRSRDPPDPQMHEAQLIGNRTILKCYTTFRGIPTSCHMPFSFLFNIHLFVNAW